MYVRSFELACSYDKSWLFKWKARRCNVIVSQSYNVCKLDRKIFGIPAVSFVALIYDADGAFTRFRSLSDGFDEFWNFIFYTYFQICS